MKKFKEIVTELNEKKDIKTKEELFKAISDITKDKSYVKKGLKRNWVGSMVFAGKTQISIDYNDDKLRKSIDAKLKAKGFIVTANVVPGVSHYNVAPFKAPKKPPYP